MLALMLLRERIHSLKFSGYCARSHSLKGCVLVLGLCYMSSWSFSLNDWFSVTVTDSGFRAVLFFHGDLGNSHAFVGSFLYVSFSIDMLQGCNLMNFIFASNFVLYSISSLQPS